ncbi:L,D-transpeptidase [Fulvimarina sp. 2208YS6-2-32]|uniref:L,D-transpeptidase n=1 Tax=Fulvimarina uroteuthidis TaxID=3098149 RepID=A0ABU5I241_9HYPH|nr:L,D-transpeptidase [Fulvimarina sp. 2208YS6-2-32]MDY8109441.1 L,D-transpeptidase [Fulvimarina sp. 2208YS6-2-32]
MNIDHLIKAGIVLAGAGLLQACSTGSSTRVSAIPPMSAQVAAAYAGPSSLTSGSVNAVSNPDYASVVDDGYALPAIPSDKIDPKYLRQQVSYPEGSQYEPGTVVVDTPNRFLYIIEPGGMAMRYGIGVGAAGFSWSGDAYVNSKQHWPKWHPPGEMIDRKPELEKYRNGGMEPGLTNPLGARALYLFQGGRDTLFRIHGTPEWWTIGTAASSGCIRMMNQDVIDVYERVPRNAKVIVKQGQERLAQR